MDVPTRQANYQVRLYDTAGALKAVFDDWRTMELQRRVGTYDLLTFGIDGADSRRSLFTLDSLIEVWRKLADTPASSRSYTGPGGYAYTVLQDHPVGYWRLGEAVGQPSASDTSGNGNTGTYSGGVTLEQAGALAPELDGTSDTSALFNGAQLATVPYNATLGFTSAFSVELWIYKIANGNFNRFGGRGLVTAGAYDISVVSDNSNQMYCEVRNGGGIVNFTKTGVIALSTWAHLVFTYDGSFLRTYLNGVQVGASVAFTGLTNQLGNWIIGFQNGGSTPNSRIDDFAVYPSALSAARVQAHYNAGLDQHHSDNRTYTIYTPGVTYPWYKESTLMHRTPSRQITERGTRIFTSYSRGLIDLLRRREIMYPANTPFTLKGGPAETVIKEYVEENAGPSALFANGRAADGALSGFTVEPSAGRGIDWAGQRSWQNLLDVLQEISAAGAVDYDVVRTDTPGSGAATFEFRCYSPQLGTDRSATVQFATLFDNMESPYYTLSRTEEYNRVVVLGAGQDTSRRFIVDESAYIADSPWNTIEKSQDASQESTLSALIAIADAALEVGKPQETLTFQTLQTASLLYGRDYFLGDIVTAAFDDDIVTTKKITGVTLNMSEGHENVGVTFSDLPVYA